MALVAVLYFGNLLALLLFENHFVYRSTAASDHWVEPSREELSVEDVTRASADGNLIHSWWCPVPNWKPEQGAVLYCHGNSGNSSDRIGWIRNWILHVGLPLLIFDYPGYGKSTGTATETGCYTSADAAYAWLTEQMKIPPEKIVLHGESLGGGVAVDLASRRPHRAMVLFRTFPTLPDVAQRLMPWLPANWLMRNRFDNLTKIADCRGPVFMAHGTADRLIPFAMAHRLFDAASEPKRFFAEEGKDHASDHPDELYDAVRRFLEEKAN
ncbi:MAG TPA: alpha/beta hydrolase [Gemmataceae bacterium]|nr:alpha/beta hydrolase [Gemmataceae bacterium]